MSENKVIVIDFDTESAKLIAEILNKENIDTEIVPHTASAESIRAKNPCGLILSGGNETIENDEVELDDNIFELKIPILGIAYGMQCIVRHFGGKIEKNKAQGCSEEILHCYFEITKMQSVHKRHCSYETILAYLLFLLRVKNPIVHIRLSIFEKVEPSSATIWLNNSSEVYKLPQGFEIIGRSLKGKICAIVDFSRNIYALQFHPEAEQSKCGAQILSNFARHICGCA